MTGSDHETEEARKVVDALTRLLRPRLAQSKPLCDLTAAVGELLLIEAQRAQCIADSTHDAKTSDDSVLQQGKPADNAADKGQGDVNASPRIIEAAPTTIQGPRAVVDLKIGDAHAELEVRDDPQAITRAQEAACNESDAREQVLVEEIDLSLIVTRCQLKAEACHAVVQRRRAPSGSDKEHLADETIVALIAKARDLHECYLWMVNREREQPDDEDLIRIGLWYDAMARTVQAMILVDQNRSRYENKNDYSADVESAMQMLAHANSGLREALSQAGVPRSDSDQDELYQWLRWETNVRKVFLHRYMKIDDVPDITSSESLCDESRMFVEKIESLQHKSKEESELLKKIAYHAEQIVTESSLDETHDWSTIEASLKTLLDDMGLKAKSKKLRMVLDPLKNMPPKILQIAR